MVKGKFNVLIGGQAGSEAKGKLSAYLVEKFGICHLSMASSPNAGHTVIMGKRKIVTYHLPAGLAGIQGDTMVFLGPTSILRLSVLEKEIKELSGNIPHHVTLIIDPRATIITPAMTKKEEDTLTVIGSTAQGVGMARIARIGRVDAVHASDVWEEIEGFATDRINMALSGGSHMMAALMDRGVTILHESTQGFDLCLDHGIDPVYCTTRNITTAGALAEMGVSPRYLGHVYGVIRPYPIRVNNRDGSSGPYAEAAELDWEMIRKWSGAPQDIAEYTTTTHLLRRVFEFSWVRYAKFINICRPDFICLQFANYLDWGIYQNISPPIIGGGLRSFLLRLRDNSGGAKIAYLGTGPDHRHMIDSGVDSHE